MQPSYRSAPVPRWRRADNSAAMVKYVFVFSVPRFDDEFAAHAAAAVVNLQAAVIREGAGAIGAKFKGDPLSRVDALGDAVRVDRHAVRDVAAAQLDLDGIVLVDFEARRVEGVSPHRDGERPGRRPLIL